MRKPLISPLALHFRQYLRTISTSPRSINRLVSSNPFPLPRRVPLRRLDYNSLFLAESHPFCRKLFSSQVDDASGSSFDKNQMKITEEDNSSSSLAKLLSNELLKSPESETLPLPKRLDLSFSHITITPTLLLSTLNVSPNAGLAAFDFLKWAKSRPGFVSSDEVYSFWVNYYGREKDFDTIHDVLIDGRGVVGVKCFEAFVNRLVREGKPAQSVSLFDKMKKEYGFKRDMNSLKFIVTNLCDKGFPNYAEKMVKRLANEFFPDNSICDALINGWCSNGKLDEARRLANEMYRGGFEISVFSYNALLDCVSKLCRQKDPFRLHSETQNLLIEMERNGVPRNVGTFNVLITNLCKMRKTEEAMKVFFSMGEWNCYPNETTFIVLIKSLYRAARTGEGDEMIDKMKSSGYGEALDTKTYYEFIRILCGIERVDHALSVFEMMKRDGGKPGIKTYELLMVKFCAHGRFSKANVIYKEAESNGICIEAKEYKVDPNFVKKKPVAVEKKRETLPEKMARKRRSLKKIRLSFVKKPKRTMRRA